MATLPDIIKLMSDEFSPPSRLGIGRRPFDINGGRGKAVNLVSWSDSSRQGIHPASKLDAKWHDSSGGSWNETCTVLSPPEESVEVGE